MADIEGKLKQPAKPGMYTIKMAHPGKAMFSPMGCEGKMHNTPYVEVDTRTEKVRPREGRNKAMNFDQKEAYMVGGGKFVSINQVPGDNGKYESDPYDHPTSFVPFTGGQASFGSKDASKRDEFSDLKRLAKHREFLRTLERLDANDDPEEMARSRREFAEEERVFAEERPLIYDLINGPPITAKERAAADRAKKAAGPAKSPNHMWATSTQSYGSGSDAPRGDAPRVNFGRVSTTKEFATQGHL